MGLGAIIAAVLGATFVAIVVVCLTQKSTPEKDVPTEAEYLAKIRSHMPPSQTINEIAPSVQVFVNGSAPSDEIKNDVDESAKTIEAYLSRDTSRVIFITHGFFQSIKAPWLHDMKNEILSVTSGHSQIVVLVGWKKGASPLHEHLYWQAAANTIAVGNFIGEVVIKVKKHVQASRHSWNDLQIYGIGHSLGSHVMGTAGKRSRSAGFPFSRITGLDPAGPSFEKINLDIRLSKTDADFVDAIHTDGSPAGNHILLDHYGTLIPLGHLDFYPNGGRRYQPGCKPYPIDVVDVENELIACSHEKAIDYYIWSISNKGKFASATKQIVTEPTWDKIDTNGSRMARRPEMGYYADTVANRAGWWIVDTKADAPYVA